MRDKGQARLGTLHLISVQSALSYREAVCKLPPLLIVGSLIKPPIMVPKTLQAGYPNTTGFRKVVKATIYIKKKEGMADEDFIEYYNSKHAQRAVPILQRHGIISYSLVILLLLHMLVPQWDLWLPKADTLADIPSRPGQESDPGHHARQSEADGL
jgi:hypothetical protein